VVSDFLYCSLYVVFCVRACVCVCVLCEFVCCGACVVCICVVLLCVVCGLVSVCVKWCVNVFLWLCIYLWFFRVV